MDVKTARDKEEEEALKKEVPDTLFTETEEGTKRFTLGQRLTTSFPSTPKHRGSIIARPIFETLVREALAEEQRKRALETPVFSLSRLTLDHRKSFVRWWKLARYALVMYSLLTTMFFLAFEDPSRTAMIVDLAVWIFFVADLVLCCCCIAHHDEDNRLIDSHGAIFRRYARRWLLPDLVAVLPLQLVGQPEAEHYLRMFRLLKVPTALDILTHNLIKAVQRVRCQRTNKPPTSVDLSARTLNSIVSILVLVVFYTYAMACFWYWFVSKVSKSATGTFHVYVDPYTELDTLQRTWYFILSTLVTVGYGDLTPLSLYERAMLILVLFTGVSTYSYIIGKFNTLVADLYNFETDRFGEFTLWIEQLETLNSKLPTDLRSKLLAAFFYYNSADRLKGMALRWWEAESIEDLTTPMDSYLAQLPMQTLRELQLYLFSDVFSRFKGFFGKENFKFDLSFHFHPRQFCSEEIILREGEEVQEILLVMKGQVGVGPILDGEFTSVLIMKQRAIVGDYAALAQTTSFTNYRAEGGDVTGFAVPTKPFLAILNGKYGNLRDNMMVFSSRRANFAKETIKKTLEDGRFCPIIGTNDTEAQEKEPSLVEAPAPRLSIDLERRADEVVVPRQKRRWEEVDESVQSVAKVNKRFDSKFLSRRKAALRRCINHLRLDLRTHNPSLYPQ